MPHASTLIALAAVLAAPPMDPVDAPAAPPDAPPGPVEQGPLEADEAEARPLDRIRDVLDVIGGYDEVTIEERAEVVLLRGEVSTAAARLTAEEIAVKVADPIYVANAIEVVVPDATEPEADDASLATDERDLALESQLRRIVSTVDALSAIEVSVQAAIVHLRGATPDQEALDRTVAIASSLEGVLFVDNGVVVETTVRGQLEAAWHNLRAKSLSLVGLLPMLGLSILALLAALALARGVLRSSLSGRLFSDNPLLQTVARRVLATIIAVAGIVAALDLMNATGIVGALLGTAGIVGLAVGFAFKDIVENYLAGVLLAVSRPFEPKDAVKIGEWEGKVIRLSARETMLMTYDGNHVQIPNAEVFGSAVLNYSRNPKRRFDFIVGIGNGEDLSRAQRVANQAMMDMAGVMDKPAPYTRLDGFGDSSMQLHFYGWVDQTSYDFTKVMSEAIRTVKRVMEENDIDLPNPITQIQLESTEPAKPKPRVKESAAPAHDLVVDTDIEEQIDAESTADDLLRKTAA